MVFAPDWSGDGGVSAIFPDGRTVRHLAKNWPEVARQTGLSEPLRPNGICLLPGGDFLLAHLGAELGGIFRLSPDGSIRPECTHSCKGPLPPCNFVTVDRKGRTYLTVSTRHVPRARAYRSDIADGFIALIENGQARILADGLGYTNECLPHPDGKRLFVNETFARRLASFDIDDNGELTNRQTIATFGEGTFPDGLAFDQEGSAWVTSIVSNRVLKVGSDGTITTYLEDCDPEHLTWVENAWCNHTMGRPHLDKAAGKYLRNVSNLAFCGEGLDHGILGCLLGNQLAEVPLPVRGAEPTHWTSDITDLIRALEKLPDAEQPLT